MMGEVTVFVDDAVLSRLPGVCARTGEPADGRLMIESTVGDAARLGVWWLLVLTGPLGWIALAVLATHGRERVTVEVPWSSGAHEALVAARRVRLASLCALVGLVAVMVVLLGAGTSVWVGAPAALVAGAAFVGYLVGVFRVDEASIDVHLDASRRWVTFSRVHPTFAAACEARPRLAESR